MKTTLFVILFSLCLMMSAGCFHTQVLVDKEIAASDYSPDYSSSWTTFIVWGLLPLSDVIYMDEVW